MTKCTLCGEQASPSKTRTFIAARKNLYGTSHSSSGNLSITQTEYRFAEQEVIEAGYCESCFWTRWKKEKKIVGAIALLLLPLLIALWAFAPSDVGIVFLGLAAFVVLVFCLTWRRAVCREATESEVTEPLRKKLHLSRGGTKEVFTTGEWESLRQHG